MSSLLGMNGGGGIDLTSGLVAHYLLNNNSDDSFGTYDGTSVGGVDFQGDVAKFDGVNDYISTDRIAINSDFTISGWLRKNDSDSAFIISNRGGDTPNGTPEVVTQREWQLSYYTPARTMASFAIFDSVGGVLINMEVPSLSSVAHTDMRHFAITLSGNTLTAYINGVVDATDTFVGTRGLGCIKTIIAQYGYALLAEPSLDADLANVRIYDTAKTQDFIDELYAEGYYPKPLPLPTTDGLITHYPLTGTAEDKTGNYDGIEKGSLAYVNDANFGSTSYFNEQVGTHIESINTSPILTATQKNLTMALWVDLSTVTPLFDRQYLISKRAVGGNPEFGVIYYHGTSTLTIYGNDGAFVSGSFTNISFSALQTWTHLLITQDGTTATLYIDGVLHSTISYIYGDCSKTAPICLGTYSPDSNYGQLNGRLREVSLHTSILTQQEVTDIYNYEKNFRPIDIDDRLVAYYPLAKNSLDNYYNEYDGVDTAMVYDGVSSIFDGTFRNIAINPAYSVSSRTSWSIVCWVKINSVASTSFNMIFNAPKYDYGIWAKSNGTYQMFIWTGSTTYQVSPIIPSFDEFHHLVMTYDGTTLRTYINSIPSGSLTVTTTPSTHNANGWIGRHGALSPNMNGAIAHVRSYNGVLSQERINVVYNTEKGEFE